MPQLFAPPPKEYVSRNLIRQLERIETLPPKMSGVYLVRDQQDICGAIYIDRGQLCWAMALGMERRLTELLCASDDGRLHPQTLQRVYRHCKEARAPLGETLIKLQLVSSEGLREALVRQTVESLLQLSPFLKQEPGWVAHDEGTYHPQFSFGVVEAASWVGGLLHERARAHASRELKSMVPAGCFAAGFVWPETDMDYFPVFALCGADRTIATALDLGRFSHNQLQLGEAVSKKCNAVVGLGGNGHAVVTWVFDSGYCAVVCESTSQMARLLSNLSRKRGE